MVLGRFPTVLGPRPERTAERPLWAGQGAPSLLGRRGSG